MESLAARARSAMNLLLITALLTVWAASRDMPDVVQTVTTILAGEQWKDVSDSINKPMGFDAYQQLKSEGSKDSAINQALQMDVRSLLYIFPAVDEEYRKSEGKAKDEKLEQLRIELLQLQRIFNNDTDLNSNATVLDLVRAVEHNRQLRLPFIDETVSLGAGVTILALAQILILLYLSSLTLAIQESVRQANRIDYSWIGVHSSRLGIVLGTVWILSPTLAQIVVLSRHGGALSYWLSAGAVIGTGVAAIFTVRSTWQARRLIGSRRKQLDQCSQAVSVELDP